MSGKPWEKFAPQAAAAAEGPWTKFQPETEAESGSGALDVLADTAGAGARAPFNALVGGYAPQLAGIARAAMPDPLAAQNEELRSQGFKIEEPEFNSYLSGRDDASKLLEEDRRKHPYVTTLGTLAGGVIGGMAAAPLLGTLAPGSSALMATKAAQGAGLAGKAAALGTRALGAGMQAGVVGALSNPGDHEGEIDPIQAGPRAKQALLMGALGFPLHMAAEGVVSTLPVVNGLRNYAADKYAKAIGMTKAQYKKLLVERGKEGVRDLGRTAREEGLIPFFSTPAKVAERAEAAKEKVGQQLEELLTDTDAAAAAMPPVGYMPTGPERTLIPAVKVQPVETTFGKAGKAVELQPKVQFQPMEPSVKLGKPVTQKVTPDTPDVPVRERVTELMPDGSKSVSFKMGEPEVIPGVTAEVSTVERGMEKSGPLETIQDAVQFQPMQGRVRKSGPVQTIQEPVKMTPVEPVQAGRINSKDLATQLRRDPKIQEIMTTPGREGDAAKVRQMLETLEEYGSQLTLKDALKLKMAIDETINYSKAIPEMTGTQPARVRMRNAVRDKMNDVVNDMASKTGAKSDELLQTNRRYGKIEQIEDIATNRDAMNESNRAIGLTDTISGGAGASAGATIGGYAAGPAGAKVGAGIGGALGVAGNKFARTFGPSMVGHGADGIAWLYRVVGPELAAQVAKNPAMLPMVIRALNPGATLGQPEGIPTPDPWLEQFKINPALIDTLQNETLKAQIKERLGRKVTGGK